MTSKVPYVVAAVETGVPWPIKETRVIFQGQELLLRPETDQLAPDIVLEIRPPLDEDDAVRLVKRFLTALAWVSRQPVIELITAGQGMPIRIGKRPMRGTQADHFFEDYLPVPEEPHARLALALYRQALGVNDVAYECLAYFRIMNLVHRGDSLRMWLETAVDHLTSYDAQNRLPALRADAAAAGRTIGEYLYVARRCALAHASADDSVNPDERADVRLLYVHQPIIRALAEYVIEKELGVVAAQEWRRNLERYRGYLGQLRSAIEASKHLGKVFEERWFQEASGIIEAWGGAPGLGTDARTALIGFIQDKLLGVQPNLMEEIDAALDVVMESTRRRLADKLRAVSGDLVDYVSAVFEVLLVGKFAAQGLLREYEPQLSDGHRADAKVVIEDGEVLIEVRATLDSAFPRTNGAYDPGPFGRKVASKIAEKYRDQLSAATMPVLLCFGLNMNLHLGGDEQRIACELTAGDPASSVLSGIVFADDFRGRRFEYWRHPGARRPLSPAAEERLRRILGLSTP